MESLQHGTDNDPHAGWGPDIDELCTVSEAARRLGVSTYKIWSMVRAGELALEDERRPALLLIANVDALARTKKEDNRGGLTTVVAAKIIGVHVSFLRRALREGFWLLDRPIMKGRGNETRLPMDEVMLVAALCHIGVPLNDAAQLAQSGRVTLSAGTMHIAPL